MHRMHSPIPKTLLILIQRTTESIIHFFRVSKNSVILFQSRI